jgi:hypothetical protein
VLTLERTGSGFRPRHRQPTSITSTTRAPLDWWVAAARAGAPCLFGGVAAASGVGELAANFAVGNAVRAAKYAKINGFRSEIDGLGQWLSLWAHTTTMRLPKDGCQ